MDSVCAIMQACQLEWGHKRASCSSCPGLTAAVFENVRHLPKATPLALDCGSQRPQRSSTGRFSKAIRQDHAMLDPILRAWYSRCC